METLAALGLTGNVLQILDFSFKLAEAIQEIKDLGTRAKYLNAEELSLQLQAVSKTVIVELRRDATTPDEFSLLDTAINFGNCAEKHIQLLNSLKPRENGYARNFRAGIKMRYNDGQLMHLSSELHSHQTAFQTQLLLLLRKEQLTQFVRIKDAAESNCRMLNDRLDRISKHLGTAANHELKVRDKLLPLRELWLKASNETVHHRLLSTISFDQMHTRYENVTPAFPGTFEWLFDSSPINTGTKFDVGRNFQDWLLSRSGIFHITGKLASGKSTLMKFIARNERTEVLLRDWAAKVGKDIVLAKFFFWAPGTSPQRSQDGLLRSLLFECLSKLPQFSPVIFPKEWAQLQKLDCRVQSPLGRVDNVDISKAFERLICNSQLFSNHRFCFLIDGLDEYDEPEKDCMDLISLFRKWTKNASEDLKIITSSREMNFFTDSLPKNQQLCLQELTIDDIKLVVRARLRPEVLGIAPDINLRQVISKIISRSNGIFLWATLVVDSVRDGLAHGDNASKAEANVDELPSKLKALFQALVDKIPKNNWKEAQLTFELVHRSGQYVPLFWYPFLIQCCRDSSFAELLSISSLGMTLDDIFLHEKLGRRNLYGCCRGLVEVLSGVEAGTTSAHCLSNNRVSRIERRTPNGASFTRLHQLHNNSFGFAHRSVPEFLTSCGYLTQTLTQSDLAKLVCQCAIAYLKSLSKTAAASVLEADNGIHNGLRSLLADTCVILSASNARFLARSLDIIENTLRQKVPAHIYIDWLIRWNDLKHFLSAEFGASLLEEYRECISSLPALGKANFGSCLFATQLGLDSITARSLQKYPAFWSTDSAQFAIFLTAISNIRKQDVRLQRIDANSKVFALILGLPNTDIAKTKLWRAMLEVIRSPSENRWNEQLLVNIAQKHIVSRNFDVYAQASSGQNQRDAVQRTSVIISEHNKSLCRFIQKRGGKVHIRQVMEQYWKLEVLDKSWQGDSFGNSRGHRVGDDQSSMPQEKLHAMQKEVLGSQQKVWETSNLLVWVFFLPLLLIFAWIILKFI